MNEILTDQLQELLEERIGSPAELLLGIDMGELLRDRAAARAPLYAAQLLSDDRRLAAQTAIDLAVLLPDAIPTEFWATPLGAAMAATYEVAPAVVTIAEAAKILGVNRARAYQLVDAGKLVRADGGVTLASVMERQTALTGTELAAWATGHQIPPASARSREQADADVAAERDSWNDERGA